MTTPQSQPSAPEPVMITIVRDRYVPARSWAAYSAPLGVALTRVYRSDAHFGAYSSPAGCRLSSAEIGATAITMTTLVLDVDGPGHAATGQWRVELHRKVAALFEVRPGF